MSSFKGEPEADMSWFIFAVDKKKNCVILDCAPGWSDFNIEFHWEDTFDSDPPLHLSPGAYRWTGFKLGFWDEDDAIKAAGGVFEPFTAVAIKA